MNPAQIHLALNHVPILLSITGATILLVGSLKNNDTIKLTAVYVLLCAAIFAVPVFLTGEGTEEIVEKIQGISQSDIEKHESSAKISLILIIATGIVALASAILKRKKASFKIAVTTSLILALASFGSFLQTAHSGGIIRHTELRSNSATQNQDSKNHEQPIKNESEKDEE
ncbi:MAG TPA: hypothetical protein VFN30_08675 [Chitinophagaceae bacterium]|nr:hypothetical protein [Chitinophagaceae bacterium]